MTKVALIILNTFFISLVHAGESSVYDFSWLDPDKEVYVLQNRKYRKAKKVHFNVGYGFTTSGPFVNSVSLQGRVGVFLHEEWGVELLYSLNNGKENEVFHSVVNRGGPGSTPFRRIVKNYMGGMFIWSPFYAKINTFNFIVYLDWMFGIGLARLTEENNARSLIAGGANIDPVATREAHSGLLWQTTFNVYLGQVTSLRIDFTAVHYKATKPASTESEAYHNYDLTASLGVRF
ncbi:MAG: outer membrane beta-barrel domain-containing protein [Halobacteriovoraceae bacterium]|nr:outer membrane beta-barrel domain-containing protein [Halobacteriovoraceae bacterium]